MDIIGAGFVSITGLQPGRYLPGLSTFSLYVTGSLQLPAGPLDVKLGQVPASSFPH